MVTLLNYIIQLALCICGFCVCGFNQLGIKNIREKSYVVADVYYVARPAMSESVMNTYRLFSCLFFLNYTV